MGTRGAKAREKDEEDEDEHTGRSKFVAPPSQFASVERPIGAQSKAPLNPFGNCFSATDLELIPKAT